MAPWWNETGPNGADPADATDLRVSAVPRLSEVFQEHLVGADNLLDAPPVRAVGPGRL